MRHNVKTKKFSRDADHKKALTRNLASQLIMHEQVETTLAKAKYIRPYVEKLVTKVKNTKEDKLSKFNTVKYLRTKLYSIDAIKKLVDEIGPRYKNRPGGYTKITRTRNRDGDKALMGRIEFVREPKKEAKQEKKEKNTRTGSKKKEGVKKDE